MSDAASSDATPVQDAAPGSTPSALPGRASLQDAMLRGPLLKPLLQLAVPTTLVLIAQSLVGVAENWYASFLGTEALAGVSLVFPVVMLMTMMSNGGIGSGVASAVARALGANRREDANALVWHAVVLALAIGLVFSVLAWMTGPALYTALGGRAGALDAALQYSNYVFAGSIPFWLVNLLAAALRGAGEVRVPALVTLVGAAVFLVVTPGVIFGFGPVPAMGLAGAGLAMTLFYVGAALWLLRYMASGRAAVRLTKGSLEPRLLRDILRVGLLTALSSLQPNLMVMVITAAVGLFGVEALAGYGMASRLDYLIIPILFGLGTAVLTLVGTNVGAGQHERARRIAWLGGGLGFVAAGAIGLAAALAPEVWLHAFSREPAVVAPGLDYLRIVAPFYGLLGLGFVLAFAAQGAGHVLWPFLAGTSRLVISAGVGWFVAARLDAGLSALFAMVAAGLVAYAGVTIVAVLAGAIFRREAAPRGT
ncbi:MATE efflux family protein [Myxococcus xanthus DK 1622]|uniref:MATE efflux family protein n=2 Tax=Myxococcaceae TaxID=31 RepID=Q1CXF2_MYXXD|nr:MATE efflux family protein [Myxococcus xanthus DK 1622]NOJ51330.1 MATE family efflux transporter [Myxococcus xanthus]QPM79103.1 MATE family efflux transporter [Myxococcus xanthus]QVW68182.1 MATE family efflux transporter [Myxococcus xanthus DZ2]UEO05704.1 MATE family efflux transporter [Myxococcus xanthus DZ2]